MKKENLTNTDIEFYLLNREYNELKGDEKKLVDEQISSEQEFNELKAILQGVSSVFLDEPELLPDPKIKAQLLKEFNSNRPATGYWSNGIILTLFPREKKLFHKPGIQFIGLAASIALIIGIFINVEKPVSHQEVAQHKTQKEDLTPVVAEEIEGEIENKNQKFAEEKEAEKQNSLIEESEEESINQGQDKNIEINYQKFNSLSDANNETISNFDKETNNTSSNSLDIVNYLSEDQNKTELDESETNYDLVVSGDVPATSMTESAGNAEIDDFSVEASKNVSTGSNTKPVDRSPKKDKSDNSRSLSEDAELISLLYTAM